MSDKRKIEDSELTEVTGGTGISDLANGGIPGVPVSEDTLTDAAERSDGGVGNLPLNPQGGGSGSSEVG